MAGAQQTHVIGTVSDFPSGQPRVVKLGRREIGVFNIEGRFFALPNLCPHQAGPLCRAPRTTGTLTSSPKDEWAFEWSMDGEIVSCPWHGMEFHIPTGQSLAHREIRVRSYEIVIDGGNVCVLI